MRRTYLQAHLHAHVPERAAATSPPPSGAQSGLSIVGSLWLLHLRLNLHIHLVLHLDPYRRPSPPPPPTSSCVRTPSPSASPQPDPFAFLDRCRRCASVRCRCRSRGTAWPGGPCCRRPRGRGGRSCCGCPAPASEAGTDAGGPVGRGCKVRQSKSETNGRSARGHAVHPHLVANLRLPRKPEPGRVGDARSDSDSALCVSVRAIAQMYLSKPRPP